MSTVHTIDTDKPSLPRKFGPLKSAMGEMIADLSKLYLTEGGCPDYPSFTPTEEDHQAVAEHVRAVTIIAGRWLRKVGLVVQENALCPIEMTWFSDGTFLEAVDGWATDQIANAARAAADEIEDAEGDAGDRRWDERRV